ncbi:hypothetical protein T12_16473 [Trichinella patagoniensis]|uniref:Uncharacterized protein n=1 Tax=Trichinella patagoniensis TaxID=990121 RepID=A0A0V1AFB6_9BILA|nr:hypothetical protein T12_16473 [Trichinella patagoniensis]
MWLKWATYANRCARFCSRVTLKLGACFLLVPIFSCYIIAVAKTVFLSKLKLRSLAQYHTHKSENRVAVFSAPLKPKNLKDSVKI